MATVTRSEVRAALDLVITLGRAIHDAGSIPAGHLYASVLGSVDLPEFDAAIGFLVQQGLVRRDASHLLTWAGD